jgi:hypothetical protein
MIGMLCYGVHTHETRNLIRWLVNTLSIHSLNIFHLFVIWTSWPLHLMDTLEVIIEDIERRSSEVEGVGVILKKNLIFIVPDAK